MAQKQAGKAQVNGQMMSVNNFSWKHKTHHAKLLARILLVRLRIFGSISGKWKSMSATRKCARDRTANIQHSLDGDIRDIYPCLSKTKTMQKKIIANMCWHIAQNANQTLPIVQCETRLEQPAICIIEQEHLLNIQYDQLTGGLQVAMMLGLHNNYQS